MFGTKLLLNEASGFDPRLEPKYLQFHVSSSNKIGRKVRCIFSVNPPTDSAEMLIPHHYQRCISVAVSYKIQLFD